MALRDLALLLFLFAGIPASLRYPFFGICVYAWLGLMNPHRLTWGFAHEFAWAQIYGITALFALLLERDRQLMVAISKLRLLIIYIAWMAITTYMALLPDRAELRIVEVLKIYVMTIATLSVLTTEKRVETFTLVAVLSVGFFGIKGGVFTILSGGNFRVWGPPGSVIEDNNQLAVALTMTVPLMYWMYRRYAQRWARLALFASMGLVVVSILGSHSRGALLALSAMGVIMIAKSDRRGPPIALAIVGALIAVAFMPEAYWERMKSITSYDEDKSAYGRLNSWATAINIANSRFTGGGFDYTSFRVFQMYAPDPTDVKSAHSIYFQALGEHGWIGFAIFLAVWLMVWLNCRAGIRKWKAVPGGESLALLCSMLQVSLVGFLVGGAFVNIGHWDFPFYIAAVACAIPLLAKVTAVAENPSSADEKASWRGPGAQPGHPLTPGSTSKSAGGISGSI